MWAFNLAGAKGDAPTAAPISPEPRVNPGVPILGITPHAGGPPNRDTDSRTRRPAQYGPRAELQLKESLS